MSSTFFARYCVLDVPEQQRDQKQQDHEDFYDIDSKLYECLINCMQQDCQVSNYSIGLKNRKVCLKIPQTGSLTQLNEIAAERKQIQSSILSAAYAWLKDNKDSSLVPESQKDLGADFDFTFSLTTSAACS